MRGEQADRPNFFVRGFRWVLYHCIAIPVLQVLTRVTFGLRMKGRKNIRGLDGAVLCCNHVHYLDSAMIACAVSPRRVTFASQPDNFHLPVAGWLVRQLGCISVGSSVQETKDFIKTMSARLKEGDWFGIFPEGELVTYSKALREFREGAFQIAAMSGTPVVPIMILQRPKKGWRKINLKPPLTIQFGEPIWPPQGGSLREKRRILCRQCYEAMSDIQERFDGRHRELRRL
jgi:1-acyl-sn-glycerol-3-phosphate acyltransferase